MTDVMEEFRKRFNEVPEDERLVMAYWASGNSPWDLLRMCVEYAQTTKEGWATLVEDIEKDCRENDEELGDVRGEGETRRVYIHMYEQLAETANRCIL